MMNKTQYYNNYEDALQILLEIKKTIFDRELDVNRIGIAYDINKGFYNQIILAWNRTMDPFQYFGKGWDLSVFDEYKSDIKFGQTFTNNTEKKRNSPVLQNLPDKFPFIEPGMSINEGGTLGLIVYKNKEPYILSCKHVLDTYSNKTVIDEDLLRWKNYPIGVPESNGSNIDVALSKVNTNCLPKVKYAIRGLGVTPSNLINAFHNIPVIKSGSSSNITLGYVRLLNVFTHKDDEFPKFEVQPYSYSNIAFSRRGDSGSVVLFDRGEKPIVGVIHSRAEFSTFYGDVSKGCLCYTINNVISVLKFSITK